MTDVAARRADRAEAHKGAADESLDKHTPWRHTQFKFLGDERGDGSAHNCAYDQPHVPFQGVCQRLGRHEQPSDFKPAGGDPERVVTAGGGGKRESDDRDQTDGDPRRNPRPSILEYLIRQGGIFMRVENLAALVLAGEKPPDET